MNAQRQLTARVSPRGLDSSGARAAIIPPTRVRPRAPSPGLPPSAVPLERRIAAPEHLPGRLPPGSLLAPSRLPVSPATPPRLNRPQVSSHATAARAGSEHDVGRALAQGGSPLPVRVRAHFAHAFANGSPVRGTDASGARSLGGWLIGRPDSSAELRAAEAADRVMRPSAGARAGRVGPQFDSVRVHDDPSSARAASALGARAFALGEDIFFAAGQYDPWSSAGRRLIGHELAHVLQARESRPVIMCQALAGVNKTSREYLRGYNHGRANIPSAPGPLTAQALADYDAGYRDGSAEAARAGQSLPPVTEAPGIKLPLELEPSERLGRIAAGEEGAERQEAAEEEIERRTYLVNPANVLPVPEGPPGVAGSTMYAPEAALKILDNLSKGDAPFNLPNRKGGCSWFVTEGSPYTGIAPEKSVPVQVEITDTPGKLVFKEADLQKLMDEQLKKTAAEAERTWRERYDVGEGALSSRLRKSLARFFRAFAESRMWDRVGEMVRGSPAQAGEVVLEPGSVFSKTPGKFAVVADASKIKLRGGLEPLIEAIQKAGVPEAEAPVLEAAAKLASKLKWAGRVRTAFRYGGRVLIVVAIAADLYKIYRAKDRVKAVVESAGGWAGATAGAAAFAAWWAPADVAGPWAWLGHGAGTLVSGAIGYWAGSEITRTIYELVVED